MAEDSRQRSGLADEISAERAGGVSGGAAQSSGAVGEETGSESDDTDMLRPQISASEPEALDRAESGRRTSTDFEAADKDTVQPSSAPAEESAARAFESAAGAAQAWKRVLEIAPNSPQAAQVRASMPQLK